MVEVNEFECVLSVLWKDLRENYKFYNSEVKKTKLAMFGSVKVYAMDKEFASIQI